MLGVGSLRQFLNDHMNYRVRTSSLFGKVTIGINLSNLVIVSSYRKGNSNSIFLKSIILNYYAFTVNLIMLADGCYFLYAPSFFN